MFKNQGSSSIALIIIAVLILGGGYWMWKNQTVTPPSALPKGERTSTSPLGGGSEGVESWKTYRNEKYGFEFRYPSNYILKVKVSTSEIPPGLSDVQSSRDVRVFADESTKILTFGVDVKEFLSGDLIEDNDFGSNENTYDFAFYGNGDLFEIILSTFRFTK